MRALDRKLARDLVRIRGQVLAIALVVGGGVAMWVTFLGTLDSLELTRSAYYDRYRFAEVFAQARRAPEALLPRIAAIPGVQTAESRIVVDVTLDLDTMVEPALGRLVSLPDRHPPTLNRLSLRQGRAPAQDRPFEVLVSEAFAQAHQLAPGDTVAAILNQRKRNLEVVGVALSPEHVYSLAPGSALPDDRRFGVLWVPRSTLAAAFDLDDAFNAVSLTLLRGAREPEVIAEIDRLLAAYGGLGAHGRDEQTSHHFLEAELDQLRAISRIAPPVFLAVAAFLLHIVITRLVETEREQIGLLKAFGYSDLAVGWHYLKLVLAIVALGIAFGFLGGAWLGRGMTSLYTDYFRFPFLHYRPGPGVFASAALVSVVAAAAGTARALYAAARLPPAEAMQPAPPPRYRRGLLERAGVIRWISQPSRMILRHLGRWPLRAALTVLGVAASIALLIGARFSVGAFPVMIDVQFFVANPHDVAVSLVEPRHEGAVLELARLPGVEHAEPYRAVGARLRAGHRSERMAVLGLEANGILARRVDADLAPVPLPEEGLVLGRGLAARLGVARGDRLEIEVLEGRQPRLEVRVVAVIEEFIGNTATLERHALNRLLEEGPVISGAYLRVDSDRQEELFGRLKETPAVASVTRQRATLESFYELWEQNMGRITLFNMLFAGVVAFGVVYNAARISLSERGRELASLRVLGLSRFEVAWILLGEMALLTLLALPVGCLLGYGLAWVMVVAFESDVYRIPLVVEPETYGYAVLAVLGAALLSGLMVRRRLERLDLVAVLKTRE